VQDVRIEIPIPSKESGRSLIDGIKFPDRPANFPIPLALLQKWVSIRFQP